MYSTSPSQIMGLKFTKIKYLGGGAFGHVNQAEKEDPKGLRPDIPDMVAVKEVRNPNGIIELILHQNLPHHPNVVRFFDWYLDPYLNLVLEYCDQGTLHFHIMKPGQSLNLEVKLEWLLDIARGIRHLHQHNIVHRDIKPPNIVLTRRIDGKIVCKIADLGISRWCPPNVCQATDVSQCYLMTIIGTPLFIAPEVYRGHYTMSCDVFSYGAVMLFTILGPQSLLINGVPLKCAGDYEVWRFIEGLPSFGHSLKGVLKDILQVDYNFRMSMESIVLSLENVLQEIRLVKSAVSRKSIRLQPKSSVKQFVLQDFWHN